MRKTAEIDGSLDGSQSPCRSTVGLSVRLPNGGLMHVEAPVGQTISAALMAQGVPLKQASIDSLSSGACRIGAAERSSGVGRELLVAPEHDGLEITLDANSVEPQTFWTAG
jgi:hypothetical protein